jgi:hypothetical protein
MENEVVAPDTTELVSAPETSTPAAKPRRYDPRGIGKNII